MTIRTVVNTVRDGNVKTVLHREVAKLSGVTIRTLQYYDNIGLLPVDKDASGEDTIVQGILQNFTGIVLPFPRLAIEGDSSW